jgi:hypothetical protein
MRSIKLQYVAWAKEKAFMEMEASIGLKNNVSKMYATTERM